MLKYLNLNNINFYLPLFFALFIYFILRALYVHPFCDEIGTFFDYVETGDIWEETPNFSSANNHLLVTYIARFFYNIFGENMFLFRLISLLSFPVYYFVSLKLIRETIHSRLNVIVFVGLMTIAWIDDFFSYARGYAFAISTFLVCIYLFIQWKRNFSIKIFILILLLSWMTVFANLAFLNSIFVLLGYSLLILVLNVRSIKKSQLVFHFSSISLFILALLPLINYSFKLKEVGALWWGNQFGWWHSTIQLLFELTLFKVDNWVFYIFLIVFISIVLWTLNRFKKEGIISFIHSTKGIIALMFFGHIFLTELLVLFVGVNYPSDRVAMIYVLFFLWLLSFVFDSHKKLNFFMLLYLFFPIMFVLQLNLDTSVYMGHTRISDSSFDAIEKEMKISKSFEMDGLDYRNYIFEMRNRDKVTIANIKIDSTTPTLCFSKYIADINDNWKPSKYYQLIHEDSNSNGRLYRYTKSYKKTCVLDSAFTKMDSDSEFINLILEEIVEHISTTKFYQISISGSLFFIERPTNFNLVYSLKDGEGNNKKYNSMDIVKYCKYNEWLNFEWGSPIYTSDDSTDKLVCFFWNLEMKKVKLRDFKVQIFDLEEVHP